MDDRAVIILLALVLAPWSLIVLAALARGYDISVSLRRRQRRRE